MGGLCTTNVQTLPDPTSVLKETEIPEWVSAGGQRLFQQAAELSASDFPLFQAGRLATYEDIADPTKLSKLTEREQKGLQLLEEEGGAYRPYLERAGAIAGDIGAQRLGTEAFGTEALGTEALGTEAFGAADLERYLPIFQQTVDPALQDVSETYARQRRDLGLAAGERGAFGERSGLESAELTRGEARERGRLLSEAGRGGLEFSAAQAERDRADAARAYGLTREDVSRVYGLTREDAARSYGLTREDAARSFDLNQASRRMEGEFMERLAPQSQGLLQQEAQGLLAGGEAERQLDQASLELAYRDYVEQREYPFTAVNFALGALKGLPFETREFSMQRGGEFIQSPSVYGQTMGGLGALASAYKLLA